MSPLTGSPLVAQHECGDDITVPSQGSVTLDVLWTLSELILSDSEVKQLEGEQILPFTAELLFYRTTLNMLTYASKKLVLRGNFAVSVGSVQPDTIHLQRVGYENMWKDVPFEFQLKNDSKVSFYAVVTPTSTEDVIGKLDSGNVQC